MSLYKTFFAVGTIDNHRVVAMTSDAEVQTVRERFATVVGRRRELLRAMRLHGIGVTSKSHAGEWFSLVTFSNEKVTLPYGTAVPK